MLPFEVFKAEVGQELFHCRLRGKDLLRLGARESSRRQLGQLPLFRTEQVRPGLPDHGFNFRLGHPAQFRSSGLGGVLPSLPPTQVNTGPELGRDSLGLATLVKLRVGPLGLCLGFACQLRPSWMVRLVFSRQLALALG